MITVNRRDSNLDSLERIALFHGCPRRELAAIDRLTTGVSLPAGKVVCREGVFGHQAFVIVSGEVSVTVAGTEVARLGPGSLCGEMALLEGGVRSATVTAVTSLFVLALSVSDFNEMLRVAPTVTRRMLVSLSSRLREADQKSSGSH